MLLRVKARQVDEDWPSVQWFSIKTQDRILTCRSYCTLSRQRTKLEEISKNRWFLQSTSLTKKPSIVVRIFVSNDALLNCIITRSSKEVAKIGARRYEFFSDLHMPRTLKTKAHLLQWFPSVSGRHYCSSPISVSRLTDCAARQYCDSPRK